MSTLISRILPVIVGAAIVVAFIYMLTATADSRPLPGPSAERNVSAKALAETSTARSTIRLWGNSRIETAVQIAQQAFPDGSRDVFLARADNFPDALAGGSLSSGPVLLVPSKGSLPSVVAEEIQRLNPEQVVALGGHHAVGRDIARQAASAAGVEATRLVGMTRYETAVRIAEYAFPTQFETVSVNKAYLVTGEDFPDALAVGALKDGPILLVPSSGRLPSLVQEYLAEEIPGEVVAIGGSDAVSNSMLGQAADAADGTLDRVAGESRIRTAVAVSEYAFGSETTRAVLARADNFPDALAASALGHPILLTQTDTLPAVVADELTRLDPWTVVAVGGESAISAHVLEEASRIRN